MKLEPDHDLLLDAVLGDEGWRAWHAATQSAALVELRRARRTHSFAVCAQVAAAVAFAGGAAWWLAQPPIGPSASVETGPAETATVVAAVAEPPSAPQQSAAASPGFISEAEMLALFPKGSCAIVEIDGVRKLIFFDEKIAREGAPVSGGS